MCVTLPVDVRQLDSDFDAEEITGYVSLQKNMGHVLQRRAPFFLYVAVTVTIAGCVVYFGWVRTWSSVYVPTMYPPFADMRVIQGAVRSVERGYDPRIANWAIRGGVASIIRCCGLQSAKR